MRLFKMGKGFLPQHLRILGCPSTLMSLEGVIKLTAKLNAVSVTYREMGSEATDREPLDALQFKQWQSELKVGRELRGRETLIRPQLQAP
jgi:hypothetical protein